MFSRVETDKKDHFLDQAKAAREERAQDRNKDVAAIKIQALIRGFLARRRVNAEIRQEIDEFLQMPKEGEEYKPKFSAAVETFKLVRRFLVVFNHQTDRQRFEHLCKYIVHSMTSDVVKHMYVSMAVNKQYVLLWIQQLKDVVWKCCEYFRILKPELSRDMKMPELSRDMKMVTVCLNMLVTFTSCHNWKVLQKMGDAMKPGMMQLCNNVMGHLNSRGLYPCLQTLLLKGVARAKPCFSPATLTAIITLATRPLISAEFSDNLLTVFSLHILAVPAVIHHISVNAEDCMIMLMQHRLFKRTLDLLSNPQSTKIVFNALEGNYALCLLANLVELGSREMEGLVENTDTFLNVVTRLLENCKSYVQNKKSHLTNWHPVLGWFSQKSDQRLNDAMRFVIKQLQILWSIKMIRLLFEPLFFYNDLHAAEVAHKTKNDSSSKNPIKKALEKASSTKPKAKLKLDNPVLVSTCKACGMYRTAMNTLSQLKMDIVAGLCYKDILLPRLWKIVTDLGPGCGIKGFLDILSTTPNDTTNMVFDLLQLSCDTASHIITILDDVELYEQNKPFTLENLVAVSFFLNNFVFKVVWNNLIDVDVARQNSVFTSVHSFLMLLYERDCRRNFTPANHWLISEVKPKEFLSELEKGRKSAQFLLQKVPHIIPHKERVILFRRKVQQEKENLGLTESAHVSPQSTLITVYRRRIIEDGYRQLALLPPNALKGLIRVKFINEQGLDEAGIDQDGVFKEFLEETIQKVFDPSLNLFKVKTCSQSWIGLPAGTRYRFDIED